MSGRAVTWAETRLRMREDRDRIMAASADAGVAGRYFKSFFPRACAYLFRLSHHHFVNGRPGLARALWQLNTYITGANVMPSSDIGGGLFIPHPFGVTIDCAAGRGLTVMAFAVIAPPAGAEGVPRLGDGVTVSHHACVCSVVTVGSGVFVSPGCMVTTDIPDGATVVGPSVRLRRPAAARQAG